jgi:hypothetical protein
LFGEASFACEIRNTSDEIRHEILRLSGRPRVGHRELQLWQRWNVTVNVLLVMTLLLIMAGIAWGLEP